MTVFNEAGWVCNLCKRRGRLELDHRLAMHLGGRMWDRRNLQCLCHECHKRKSAIERTGEDRRRWRRFLDEEIKRIEAKLIEDLEGNNHDEFTENHSANE